MAKRSGSKTSRSERRAGKQRAQRARQHGLPERRPELRVRAATPEPGSIDGEDRSSDAPPPPRVNKRSLPPLVWVLGGAIAILLGVYLLSQKRDEALTETTPEPEVSTSVVAAASAEPPAAPAAAPAEPVASPPKGSIVDPVPAASATVVVPVASAPNRPKVNKPVVVAPKPPSAATPTVATPAAPTPATPPTAATLPAQPTVPQPTDNPN